MPDQPQQKLITIPIPIAKNGINKDLEPTSLKGIYTPFMKNMVLESSRIRKRLGYSQMGLNLPLTGVGMKLYQYIDARGSYHLIACTTTHAYEYQTSTKLWLQITPSTVIDECEAGWTAGTNVTNSDDTTYFVKGSKSQKFLTTAARADGDQLGYLDLTSLDISAHSHIGFWIRSSAALAASALEVVVSESNHAAGEKTGTYVECLSTALVADTWTFVCLAKTLTSFNAVVSVSLYANAVIADATSIYLDDVRAYTEFTMAVTNRWSMCEATDTGMFTANGGDALIASNGVDDLVALEGESGDVFATLVHTYTSLANADAIEEFWNHFIIANYNDGNQNIRSLAWADIGDINEWEEGTSGATRLTDSIGEIYALVKLGADIIVYSEHSITTGRYRGGDVVYTFPTLVYKTGLFTPNGVWGTATVHYLIATDQKIYKYAGGAHLFEVGKPIQKSLFAEADISKKHHILAGYDPGRDRLYFAFPRASDTYAQAAYVLNRSEAVADESVAVAEPWEYYEFADSIRSFCIYKNQSDWYCDDTAYKDLYCDECAFYCDASYTQEGYPITVFLSHDGYVFQLDEKGGKDDATNIECEYQTQDITLDGEEHYGRWTWFGASMKSDITGGIVNVYYSVDAGVTWTECEDSPYTLTTAWTYKRFPIDVVGRKIRYKFYQNSSADLQVRNDMHCVVKPSSARD